MHQSSIQVNIGLDDQKIPQNIKWSASDSTATEAQEARAMMLTFWDPTDKTALRIDLWTKDMMVDEMGDFYYQTLMTMADSFERATHNQELVHKLKHFAQDFYKEFRAKLMEENKIQ